MKIEFKTENQAFEDYKEGAIAKILKAIADKVEGGITEGKIIDLNGNSIGDWKV